MVLRRSFCSADMVGMMVAAALIAPSVFHMAHASGAVHDDHRHFLRCPQCESSAPSRYIAGRRDILCSHRSNTPQSHHPNEADSGSTAVSFSYGLIDLID